LDTEVTTKSGKAVGASFSKATNNGTSATKEYPIEVDGKIQKVEVSIKDASSTSVRMTEIDGVKVPTKQELIDTRLKHDPRPHKLVQDAQDLQHLRDMQSAAAQRNIDMLRNQETILPTINERSPGFHQEGLNPEPQVGLDRTRSLCDPSPSDRAVDILRCALPMQSPPSQPPETVAASIAQSTPSGSSLSSLPSQSPNQLGQPNLPSTHAVADLVRLMQQEGRRPSHRQNDTDGSDRTESYSEQGRKACSKHDGTDGHESSTGFKADDEKTEDVESSKCKCGKPMRSQWNGICSQLKPTCICGKEGPAVVKLSGNIHGFGSS
jgi:hypothetical protein